MHLTHLCECDVSTVDQNRALLFKAPLVTESETESINLDLALSILEEQLQEFVEDEIKEISLEPEVSREVSAHVLIDDGAYPTQYGTECNLKVQEGLSGAECEEQIIRDSKQVSNVSTVETEVKSNAETKHNMDYVDTLMNTVVMDAVSKGDTEEKLVQFVSKTELKCSSNQLDQIAALQTEDMRNCPPKCLGVANHASDPLSVVSKNVSCKMKEGLVTYEATENITGSDFGFEICFELSESGNARDQTFRQTDTGPEVCSEVRESGNAGDQTLRQTDTGPEVYSEVRESNNAGYQTLCQSDTGPEVCSEVRELGNAGDQTLRQTDTGPEVYSEVRESNNAGYQTLRQSVTGPEVCSEVRELGNAGDQTLRQSDTGPEVCSEVRESGNAGDQTLRQTDTGPEVYSGVRESNNAGYQTLRQSDTGPEVCSEVRESGNAGDQTLRQTDTGPEVCSEVRESGNAGGQTLRQTDTVSGCCRELNYQEKSLKLDIAYHAESDDEGGFSIGEVETDCDIVRSATLAEVDLNVFDNTDGKTEQVDVC